LTVCFFKAGMEELAFRRAGEKISRDSQI